MGLRQPNRVWVAPNLPFLLYFPALRLRNCIYPDNLLKLDAQS